MKKSEELDKLSQVVQGIRDHIGSRLFCETHFPDTGDDWNKLCVAMDTLEDALLALSDFFAYGMGRNDAESYLRFYGTLQAVVLQQDAIRAIFEVAGEQLVRPAQESAWMRIRDLRNHTIGHPIEVKRGNSIRRTFVTRITLRSDKLNLITHDTQEEDSEMPAYNLREMVASFLIEAGPIVERLGNVVKTKWPMPSDE